MCMSQHTRGFQSFDINDNKVLLAYFQMCWSTLCNMQENLKHSWRAGSFHSPNQVKWHCIKGLFSFIKLKGGQSYICVSKEVKIQRHKDRKRESERERMENYRARAILLLVIFIFPALVECEVRLYDFRVSAHSLLRSYGSPPLATDKGCRCHFW
jgi:hypothetical protein